MTLSPRDPASFAGRFSVLRSLKPDESTSDDLAPLASIIADARVVGIGEGAHFVHEFGQARARLVRFLVEHCHFTHVALEVGTDEAAPIESWLASDDDDLAARVGPLTFGLYGSFLVSLRRALVAAAKRVGVIGADLPNSLTLEPSLAPFEAYLRRVDGEAVRLVEEARRLGAKVTGASAAASTFSWMTLAPAEQDALTACVSRLVFRLRALRSLYVSRSDVVSFAEAEHALNAAWHTAQMWRAMSELFAGGGLPADATVREQFIAETLLGALGRLGADAKVVYVAHNNHIQKLPVSFEGELTALPAGRFLANALGEGYRAIALTHVAGEVPEMSFPASSAVGFEVIGAPLPEPPAGSIEAALLEAGLGEAPVLVRLDGDVPALADLGMIRSQSATTRGPLVSAFDAVLSSPTATRDAHLPF